MRLSAILAASLVVHAGALAAMPEGGEPLRPQVTTPRVEVELVDLPALPPDPIAVTFLSDPVPVPVPVPVPDQVPASVSVPGSASVSVSASVSASVSETAAATATDPGPVTDPVTARALGMRSGSAAERADLTIPGESSVIAAILVRESPPPDPISGELVAQKDGTYRTNDTVFVAEIEPDGNVKLTDKPNFRYKFHVPNPFKLARSGKRWLADWVEDPYGAAMGRSEKPEDIDDDNDGRQDEGGTVTILSGGFDVTDWAIRQTGADPYASRKMAYLDRTRDDRVQIGSKYRADQLDQADQYMLDHLRNLWKDDELTAEQKRAEIFALWDDCAETGEDRLVEAAGRARAALIRFIETKLPDGSADAFTADELARFNAKKRSKAPFEPYD